MRAARGGDRVVKAQIEFRVERGGSLIGSAEGEHNGAAITELGGLLGQSGKGDRLGPRLERQEGRTPIGGTGRLPRFPSILRVKQGAQGADGPAGLVRLKEESLQWSGLARPLCTPGPAAVGRVPDNAARRAGDPQFFAADGDGAEVEDVGRLFGKGRRRTFPNDAPVYRAQDNCPVAHDPARIVGGQRDAVEAARAETAGAHVKQVAVDAGDGAVESRHHAHLGTAEIGARAIRSGGSLRPRARFCLRRASR